MTQALLSWECSSAATPRIERLSQCGALGVSSKSVSPDDTNSSQKTTGYNYGEMSEEVLGAAVLDECPAAALFRFYCHPAK